MEMRVLAGDIGGTKTLLQIAECKGARCHAVREQRFDSASYNSFSSIVEQFLKPEKKNSIKAACIGIAGPIQEKAKGQFVKVTNLPWEIDGPELKRRFRIPHLQLINDFQAIGYGIEALKPFKDQLLLEITKEGLRIQIVDKENRPMFDLGSSVMKDYTVTILHELGKLINHVPNRISLAGHTDARPYPRPDYTNWELSADRANASRRELVIGGMDDEKVARVVGLSSAVPFDKKNPTNPINRRISIVVLNKESEEAILYEMDNQDQPVMAAPAEKTSQAPAKPAAAPVATSSPETRLAPLAAAPAVATQVARADTRPSAPPPLSKLAPSNAASAAAAAASAAAAAAHK